MRMGQARLLSVQVDLYGLLVRSQYVKVLLPAQNGPLRFALSEQAITPLPRRNNASSIIEG